jgi:hypothetical protein
MEFYTQLISSILKNSENNYRLKTLHLRANIYDRSFKEYSVDFLNTFAETTAPLTGKGITLNGIPVERVVTDLVDLSDERNVILSRLTSLNIAQISSMY